jgi:hypothetical protein
MGATVGGSTEVAAVFPLKLSLAPLPPRLAEAKDKVPCFKLPELIERCALVNLCGAMVVVVAILIGLVRVMLKLSWNVRGQSDVSSNGERDLTRPTSSVG